MTTDSIRFRTGVDFLREQRERFGSPPDEYEYFEDPDDDGWTAEPGTWKMVVQGSPEDDIPDDIWEWVERRRWGIIHPGERWREGGIQDYVTLSPSGRLKALEYQIESAQFRYIDIGNALGEIRDERLYRDGYQDFDVYLKERWPSIAKDRQRANQFINAADVATLVVTYLGIRPPANEGQARQLVYLLKQPNLLLDIWESIAKAEEARRRTTAATIRTAVRAALAKASTEPKDESEVAARAQRGDIFALGDHRLMCGDSRDAKDVKRLMAGEKAALLATDPPYGAGYDDATDDDATDHGDGYDRWDHLATEQLLDLYFKYLEAAKPHLADGAAVYQWHGDLNQHLVRQAWEKNGLLLHQKINWVKPHPVPGPSHFMYQHEACVYGWVEGRPPARPTGDEATTVWQIEGGRHETGHRTEKPQQIFSMPMEWHTSPDDVCYEPFAGSGSQIIAAQNCGRRCFAMEINPRYVDQAIEWWERTFKGNAIKVSSSEPSPSPE